MTSYDMKNKLDNEGKLFGKVLQKAIEENQSDIWGKLFGRVLRWDNLPALACPTGSVPVPATWEGPDGP